MKLWDKGFSTDKKIDLFTVGNDRELDLILAKYDVIGNLAHAKMLHKIGLLTFDEIKNLGVPFGFKLNGFLTTKPKSGSRQRDRASTRRYPAANVQPKQLPSKERTPMGLGTSS